MGMCIEDGGILTTVQDGGRYGYEQYGVSPSGPMDAHSFHIANILVGNDREEACLEMTVMGATIRFTESAVIALTGADMKPQINGNPVCMYQAVAVAAGDVLRMGFVQGGCRSYLAVAGGMDIPILMNSKSTMAGKGFGGYKGRKLAAGDEIPLVKSVSSLPRMEMRRIRQETFRSGEHELRVIMGPQDDRFTAAGLQSFLTGVYRVGQEFDRMGYRLEGPVIEHKTDGNIISDGVVTGSVQVPTAGLPIVMTAERQTVGGYTKIATVITVDLPVIGQCKSGDAIRFREITVEEAQQLYVGEEKFLAALEEQMNTSERAEGAREYIVTVAGTSYRVLVEREQ